MEKISVDSEGDVELQATVDAHSNCIKKLMEVDQLLIKTCNRQAKAIVILAGLSVLEALSLAILASKLYL